MASLSLASPAISWAANSLLSLLLILFDHCNAKKAFRAQFRGVKDKAFFLYRLAKLYA